MDEVDEMKWIDKIYYMKKLTNKINKINKNMILTLYKIIINEFEKRLEQQLYCLNLFKLFYKEQT